MVSNNEFYQICRICGSTEGISINMFSEAGSGYLFKVQKLLRIKISKDDNLPKNVCHICMAYLSDFDKFHNNFGTVQTKLLNLFSNFQQENVETARTNTHHRNLSLGNRNALQNETVSTINPNSTIRNTAQRSQKISRSEIVTSSTHNSSSCRNLSQPKNQSILPAHNISTSKNIDCKNQNIPQREIVSRNTHNILTSTNKNTDLSTHKEQKESTKEIKPVNNTNDFDVHVVEGATSTNTLHVCKTCNAVLVIEAARQTHVCDILLKKRKRVIFDGDEADD